MRIACDGLVLRPWQRGDEASLVRHANNRNIWRNLRDRFPHPYTHEDAVRWISFAEAQGLPAVNLAIVVVDEPVGGIGLASMPEPDQRVVEIGYWLGEAFWGRGLATEAVRQMTAYAFATFALERIEASVFSWNDASCRVLEKAGYRFDRRLERSVLKDGHWIDQLLYVREPVPHGPERK